MPTPHTPMTPTILLFDMDGVLLRSKGYYRGLQAAIKLLGQNLGIASAEVSLEHIAKLESCGIYHIWDNMAVLSALLLTHIWPQKPDARIPTTLDPTPGALPSYSDIDFTSFTQTLAAGRVYSMAQINELLLTQHSNLSADQKATINLLLQTSQEIYQSPVIPIMQEFVLGSQQFSQTYNLPSQLNTQSYPQLYDQAALSEKNHRQLLSWLKSKNHHAAFFTNRPSSAPENFFGTPEAEIGARTIGLQSLPMIGAGALAWWAHKNNAPALSFNKPHPAHALAAMQAAVGRSIEQSLNAATALVRDKPSTLDDWQVFRGAKLLAFEDSRAGLESVQKACQRLSTTGIPIDLHLIGISKQSDKMNSLREITDQIFSDINDSPLTNIIYAQS
jgi:hypothetical protein